MKSPLQIGRKVHFSCGHKYDNPQFSKEENQEIFGSCYSEHGHGHNYTLDAYFAGEVSPETGMILNLRDIDQLLKNVTQQLDHKFLNTDVPYFKIKIPTTENICAWCFLKIKEQLPDSMKLTKVRLYENDSLWVDCWEAP